MEGQQLDLLDGGSARRKLVNTFYSRIAYDVKDELEDEGHEAGDYRSLERHVWAWGREEAEVICELLQMLGG